MATGGEHALGDTNSPALEQADRLMEEIDTTLNHIYQQVASWAGIPSTDYGSELVAKGLIEIGFLLLIPPTLPELGALSGIGAVLTGAGAVVGGLAATAAISSIVVAIVAGLIVLSTSGEANESLNLALDVSSGPLAPFFAASGSFLKNGAREGTEQGARLGKLADFFLDTGSAVHKIFGHEHALAKASEVLHTAYAGVDLVESRPQTERIGTIANNARALVSRISSYTNSVDLPRTEVFPFNFADLEKGFLSIPAISMSETVPATPLLNTRSPYSVNLTPSELPVYLGGGTANVSNIPETLTDSESGIDDQGLSEQDQSDSSDVVFSLP